MVLLFSLRKEWLWPIPLASRYLKWSVIMSSASFTLSITATVRAADAPLDDVISFFTSSDVRPYRHLDSTVAFVTVSVGFDNRAKSDVAGIVEMKIGYQHEADMMADDDALTAFCEACPDCDIEITSAVLVMAVTSDGDLIGIEDA